MRMLDAHDADYILEVLASTLADIVRNTDETDQTVLSTMTGLMLHAMQASATPENFQTYLNQIYTMYSSKGSIQ